MILTKKTGQTQFRWEPLYLYDLLKQLVMRDIKILYKKSMLGVGWTLISPLLQLAVFAFIFRRVLPVNISRYTSFIFCGLLVWTWFQTSLVHSTGLITGNRPMIRMPGFPIAILPIVTVMTGMIHYLIAIPVLILLVLIDGGYLSPYLFILPLLLLMQFGLTVGLAYPLAALNVTFRDTQYTIGVILQMLFYMTPVFYDIQHLSPQLQLIYRLNPLVTLLESYRNILIYQKAPNWGWLLIVALITAIVSFLGYYIFQRQSVRFVQEI
jgi:lipopolysaccharide transport system permease protein